MRKQHIEDLMTTRRLKLLQHPGPTLHVENDNQIELHKMQLYQANPVTYFEEVVVSLDQLVQARSYHANMLRVLKHTTEESVSPKFPVQAFMASKLPDYLFKLIQTVHRFELKECFIR